MYNKFQIGSNIRDIRKKRGLTIAEVGIKTNISEEMLGKIEQGNRNMTIQTIFALMDAYKVDANTLLGISTSEKSIDEVLATFPKEQRECFISSFSFMLNKVKAVKMEVFAK